MKAIVRKRQRRRLVETDKANLAFTVRDSVVVESEKIVRWMKRNGVSEEALYAPSPAACMVFTSTIVLLVAILTNMNSYPFSSRRLDNLRARLSGSESC
jgi:hypothetical protein